MIEPSTTVQPQRTEEPPPLIWFNGRIVPWEAATVHVWSELAVRGASVFDGLRAYWHRERGQHYVLSMDDHLRRLFDSAKILKMPTEATPELLRDAIFDLLRALDIREHAFVRPTLFIESGRYGFRKADTTTGTFIVAFPLPRPAQCLHGARCCVSSWTRATDRSVPPRVKAGAFYQGYRLARIEAIERRMDDAIFLNERGTVAETTNCSIFIVRQGKIFTPPTTADILESVTRQNLMRLIPQEFGVEVVEREINRTELYIADEIMIAGTLSEIQPVVEVDGYKIGTGVPGPITTAIRDRYFAICESGPDASWPWLTAIPETG
jgi:branched-chain amino acid aminotransferase